MSTFRQYLIEGGDLPDLSTLDAAPGEYMRAFAAESDPQRAVEILERYARLVNVICMVASRQGVNTTALVTKMHQASVLDYAGQKLTREEHAWVTCADFGDHAMWSINDALHIEGPSLTQAFSRSEYHTPAVLQVDDAALDLAYAFCTQMLEAAQRDSAGRAPMLGTFRMTVTGIPLIDDLRLSELRILVRPACMFVTLVGDGRSLLSWWSPNADTWLFATGQRYAWAFRTFCACLWHDLIVPRRKVLKTRESRRPRTSTAPMQAERVVMLPRTIYDVEWTDDTSAWQQRHGVALHTVRAHYRLLSDGRQRSEHALSEAGEAGFPEPPAGYTFVRAHVRGEHDTGDIRPPRIVAKGLHAAKVALSRL